MTQPLDLIQQKLALLQEAEIALYSIETGLGQLAKNRPYAPKPYYFGWFLFLSTGFERLMKVIVCLHEFETTGAFPTRNFMRNTLRHGLERLLGEVMRRCYTPAYMSQDFAQADHDFLTNDAVLAHMLSALNDFARGDRYLFMDRISQPEPGPEWPKMRWEEVERIALSDAVYFRLLQEDYPELNRRANHLTQSCIERFTRSLARLFIFGNLGDTVRSQVNLIYDFMRLEDSQLGNKVYEP